MRPQLVVEGEAARRAARAEASAGTASSPVEAVTARRLAAQRDAQAAPM
jgi:hypothetical protein